METNTRDFVVGEAVTNLMLALTDTDSQSRKRHVMATAVNGGRLLPGAVRAAWRFYRTHPGNPGTHPGPSGAQRK